MSSFMTLLRNDLKLMLKDYKTLIIILIMPLVVIWIFAQALSPLLEKSTFVEPFKIIIVDEEQSAWTGLLAAQLKNLEIVEQVLFADEKEARELIEKHEAAAAIVLPEGLISSVDYWEPLAAKVIGSNLLYLQSNLVKNIAFVGSTAVSAGLASLNVIYNLEADGGYSDEALYEEVKKANETYIRLILNRKAIISEEKLQTPDVNPVIYYALSLLAIFTLFSSIPCMKLLTEERRLGILSRLNATPTKSWETVVSKLLVSFMISAVQFSIIAIFMAIAGGRTVTSQLLSMIPVFVATTLAAGAFSLLIASLASSGSAADLIANLSILLMAIIGGSLYPLPSLPEACRPFSVLTINRWAAEGFLSALYGDHYSDTLRSCMALILLTGLFLAAASIILKIKRRRVEG